MNQKLLVLVAVIAIVALAVVSCASAPTDSRPVPAVQQLYPGVWVEIVGPSGYHNPNCGDLKIDYQAECEPWVPKVGKGQIEPYKGDEDDPFNGKWVVNGKFRVHVQYDPETRNIPGSGWYKLESLRLTTPLPTPTPWPTDTPIPAPTLTAVPRRDTPLPRPIKDNCFTYKVVSGDTLTDIVTRRYSKYNLVMTEVISDNPGIVPDYLTVGQTIQICPR